MSRERSRSPASNPMLTAAVLTELQKLPQSQRQGLQRLRSLVCKLRSLASLSTLASQMQRIGETISLTSTEHCSSDVSILWHSSHQLWWTLRRSKQSSTSRRTRQFWRLKTKPRSWSQLQMVTPGPGYCFFLLFLLTAPSFFWTTHHL